MDLFLKLDFLDFIVTLVPEATSPYQHSLTQGCFWSEHALRPLPRWAYTDCASFITITLKIALLQLFVWDRLHIQYSY